MDGSAEKLTDLELAELEKAFSLFAKDGTIQTAELGSVISALGHDVTEEELMEMITEVEAGVKMGGDIQFSDFCGMMSSQTGSESALQDAFELFDGNGDGFISIQDLRYVMEDIMGETLSHADAVEMIREMDGSGKGLISYTEFCRCVAGEHSGELNEHWRTITNSLVGGKDSASEPLTHEIDALTPDREGGTVSVAAGDTADVTIAVWMPHFLRFEFQSIGKLVARGQKRLRKTVAIHSVYKNEAIDDVGKDSPAPGRRFDMLMGKPTSAVRIQFSRGDSIALLEDEASNEDNDGSDKVCAFIVDNVEHSNVCASSEQGLALNMEPLASAFDAPHAFAESNGEQQLGDDNVDFDQVQSAEALEAASDTDHEEGIVYTPHAFAEFSLDEDPFNNTVDLEQVREDVPLERVSDTDHEEGSTTNIVYTPHAFAELSLDQDPFNNAGDLEQVREDAPLACVSDTEHVEGILVAKVDEPSTDVCNTSAAWTLFSNMVALNIVALNNMPMNIVDKAYNRNPVDSSSRDLLDRAFEERAVKHRRAR